MSQNCKLNIYQSILLKVILLAGWSQFRGCQDKEILLDMSMIPFLGFTQPAKHFKRLKYFKISAHI